MPPSRTSRLFAFLCALVFILTAAASVVAVSADLELLSPETYKNALASQQVYPQLPSLVAKQIVLGLNGDPCADNPLRCRNAKPQLITCFHAAVAEAHYRAIAAGVEKLTAAENSRVQACISKIQPDLQVTSSGSGGVLSFFRHIRGPDLESVIAPLLPPAQMKPLADSFLDQLFAFLNGRQDRITLDLSGIKGALKGPGGLETLLLIIRSQPPCGLDQLQQLLQITLTGQGTLTLCSPAPDLLALLTPFSQTQLDAAVDVMPEEQAFTPVQAGSNRNFGPFGRGTVGAFRLMVTGMRVSLLVPWVFLVLVTLLAVRTVKDLLRWWGFAFLSAGILVILIGLIGPALFEPAWVGLLSGHVPDGLSVGLVGTAHDVVRAVLVPFWQRLDILGAAMAIPGLVMAFASAFVHVRE